MFLYFYVILADVHSKGKIPFVYENIYFIQRFFTEIPELHEFAPLVRNQIRKGLDICRFKAIERPDGKSHVRKFGQ